VWWMVGWIVGLVGGWSVWSWDYGVEYGWVYDG